MKDSYGRYLSIPDSEPESNLKDRTLVLDSQLLKASIVVRDSNE